MASATANERARSEIRIEVRSGKGAHLAAILSLENVCARCVLCMAGVRIPFLYSIPEAALREALCQELTGQEHPPQPGPAGGTIACATCLGILADRDEPVAAAIAKRIEELEYDLQSLSTFMLSLSAPSAVIIRQHVASDRADTVLREWLRAAGKDTTLLNKSKVIELKEAFRWIVAEQVSALIGAKLEQGTEECSGRLKIEVEFRHADTAEEKNVLLAGKHVQRTQRGKRERGQRRGEMHAVENINAVVAALSTMAPGDLAQMFAWPLPAVTNAPEMAVKAEREACYVGGQYCKFSREVSQSPWNEAHGNIGDSVQSLILAALAPRFRPVDAKFMGSGREDVDVRMLGEGRPFVIELLDAKTLPASPHLPAGVDKEAAGRSSSSGAEGGGGGGVYGEVEAEVNASTSLIAVRGLRAVGRSFVQRLKASGETKRKFYRALVWASEVVAPAQLAAVAAMGAFTIEQDTPVRVLHRRSLATRRRQIHALQLTRVNARFFLLDLQTEAGTYVKEFVHGDLGRTRPSLGSLLGCDADILQLDVTAVEV